MKHNAKSGSVNTLKLKPSSWHIKNKRLKLRLQMQRHQPPLLSKKLIIKIASGFPRLFLFDIRNTQCER
jgi:hypothetical protein